MPGLRAGLKILAMAASAGLAPSSAVAAQAPPVAPLCQDAPFHQFDFFLGSFAVMDASHARVADETVAAEFDGCVLHERFLATNGRAAESFSFYDPAQRQWFQYAVGLGLVFRLQGELRDGAMAFEGTITHVRRAEVRPMRARFAPLPGGNVREELYERNASTGIFDLIFAGTLERHAPGTPTGGH